MTMPLTMMQQVDNRMLAPDTARANLLVNGGFEVWQRGDGPFTAHAVWTADRWMQSFATGDTLSTRRNSGVSIQIPHTRACADLQFVRATGGTSLAQTIKASEQPISGKPLSLSMLVFTDVPDAIKIYLQAWTPRHYSSKQLALWRSPSRPA